MELQKVFTSLKAYCEATDLKGWDPFDGLNSEVFQAIPFVKSNRLFRLAWLQFFKRSPINLRRLMLVPKEHNNKGNGLFLAGYCYEYLINPTDEGKKKIEKLSQLLIDNINPHYSGDCWGYNFDWQARAFFQPKNTPTVVATTFISNALMDAYDITGDQKLLDVARSACNFVLKDLNRTIDENGNFSFSYSPVDRSVVFNASLLGSRLLSRVYGYTREDILIKEAKKSVAFCCSHQRADGSWGYGTLPFHQWVDNFHTGYNLECVSDYMKYSGDNTYLQNVASGFNYYINTFFTAEGIPKYYNNSVFPIDIHAPAQLIITLSKLEKFREHKQLLDKVLQWTVVHMRSEKGYFFYQLNKHFTSRIPYMRWAQAWMFFALSLYLLEDKRLTPSS
jgi:hypothetical protein